MGKLSVSEMTTFRWSFEEDVCQYAAAGIRAIGVWRQKLSDFGEEKAIELLQECRVSVSSLSWAGGFTGSDGRSFRESIEDAREAVRLAQALGASSLVVHSGSRAGHTHNHARRLLKSALEELLPLADDHGVWLAVEPMQRETAGEWTFLTDLDETLALLDSLGGALRMVLDTYHLANLNIWERLEPFLPHVALVHLGDSKQLPQGEPNRCPLGQGVIPLTSIISRLELAGYQGYYEVELMGEEIEASDYRDLVLKAKQFFDTATS